MKKIFLLKQYFYYLLHAKGPHGIHSPFVFQFINEVLNDKRDYYFFEEIKMLRQEMYQNSKLLKVQDFGAGSHIQNTKERKVCDIAKTAGRNEKFGKLLFRMVNHFKPQTIVELGTSMGLATLYLAGTNPQNEVYTIEGSPEIAAQAHLHFEKLELKNIHQIVGNFDDILKETLQEIGNVDLYFIDGNHRKQATIDYFEIAKPHLNENSIVIFDDIHWSQGMDQAWQHIKQDSFVTLSIDLFFVGIVFLKKDFKEKQDFILRF